MIRIVHRTSNHVNPRTGWLRPLSQLVGWRRCCVMNILGEVWKTLARYQADFPDERTCEAYLFRKRWPNGFICPRCGGGKYWQLTSRACTYQCSRSHCRQQTSITADTV